MEHKWKQHMKINIKGVLSQRGRTELAGVTIDQALWLWRRYVGVTIIEWRKAEQVRRG